MNETADPNSQIVLVAIIAFYWALLRSWGQVLPRSGDNKAKRDAVAMDPGTGAIESASSGGTSLDVIRKIDPSFDPATFLAGARAAYEIVLGAYASGDVQTLKRLVGPEVLDVFERVAAERRDRQEVLQLTFIGMQDATVVSALNEGSTTEIAVRFVADVVNVTRSANGAIVAGDPQQIIEVIDTWRFACDTPPPTKRNWVLIATEGG